MNVRGQRETAARAALGEAACTAQAAGAAMSLQQASDNAPAAAAQPALMA